jgi:fatty acid desaturase
VVGHHVHTNVMGADPDLPVDLEHDIRRLTPRQVWKAQYKYQYLYLLPLYGLLGLKFRVQDIMLTFIERANGPIDVNPIASAMWAKQVTSKITFLFWRLLFPHYIFGAGFGSIFGLFLIACVGFGGGARFFFLV